MSAEVWLVFLMYPILLDLQIRLGFQENNLSTDISAICSSHLYRYPSLSAPRCCHQEAEGLSAAAAAALRVVDLC